MKYRTILTILAFIISREILSQSDTTFLAKNILYAEVAGAGGYGSINYERVLLSKYCISVASRIGIGTYHIYDYTTQFNPDILIPVSINAFYGKENKAELGLGQTFASIVRADFDKLEPTRMMNLHTFFSAAYRYQKKTGGIFFRLAYIPILEYNKNWRHWAGISFGYVF